MNNLIERLDAIACEYDVLDGEYGTIKEAAQALREAILAETENKALRGAMEDTIAVNSLGPIYRTLEALKVTDNE